jgi:hypothetical protein
MLEWNSGIGHDYGRTAFSMAEIQTGSLPFRESLITHAQASVFRKASVLDIRAEAFGMPAERVSSAEIVMKALLIEFSRES